MTPAKIINRILCSFGIAIVRKKTFEALAGENRMGTPTVDLAQDSKEMETADSLSREQLLRHQIYAKWSVIDALSQDRDMRATLSCPLCGYHNEGDKFGMRTGACMFGGGKLIRYICPECDVIFGPEKMLKLSAAELSADYEWHYQVYSEGDSTQQEIRAFNALKPRQDGVYLNWGAGAWSNSTNILRQEGWNVYGYEPHGSASTGSPYFISDKAQLMTMQFDGIFSNNVLEHLRHPERELATMSSLLAKGGRMSHATPCFEYLYEFTRFHLFFFPGRSRAVLANKAGLCIDDFISDGEFMNIILSPRAE